MIKKFCLVFFLAGFLFGHNSFSMEEGAGAVAPGQSLSQSPVHAGAVAAAGVGGPEEGLFANFTRAIHCTDGNPFCVLDEQKINEIADYSQWQMISRGATSLFQEVLEKAVPIGSILAVRGSEFPLTTDGAIEMKGEAEVLAETKVAHDATHTPVFGYHFIPAETLFGVNIITTYAAKGYTFWSKSNVMEGLMGEPYTTKQANNRIHFQQSIGARYVLGTDIQDGGILPEATGAEEVLNALTPHVVLSTANLGFDDIRTNVDAFFANANTPARGAIPAAHAGETVAQIQTRLAAESKVNAVAVIDVEAVNVGDVHELRLGRFGNMNGYPSILPEIRRLIVTTTSEGVLRIGNAFLYDCTGLTSLDLRPLSNVTTIGNAFLLNCWGLTYVNLRGLSNVTTIGDDFLFNCASTSLDLSSLSKVTTIGDEFLGSCGALTLDLSPLSNVTTIGDEFLRDCRGLNYVNLRGLSNVITIGSSFLDSCGALLTLDLSSLSKVTTIRDFFLLNCNNLRTIKGFSHWKSITEIGSDFLGSIPDETDDVSITPDFGDVSIMPDFNDAPVPNLEDLRAGGRRAVNAIKTPEFRRFHGALGGMSALRVAWVRAVVQAALARAGGGAGASAGASAGAGAGASAGSKRQRV